MNQSDDDVIRVGDLVMIVGARKCCPDDTRFGEIFRVMEIGEYPGFCFSCKKRLPIQRVCVYRDTDGLECCCDITRLKKIKGITELEREIEVMDVPVGALNN